MSSHGKLRVLVVDDSSLFRQILSSVINESDSARLSGIASNGKDAINKIERLQPDVVTLDIEMPVMNGIDTLEIIYERWPNIKVIMVTSMSHSSIRNTIFAVEKFAFSFITKPQNNGNDHIKKELTFALNAIMQSNLGPAPFNTARPSHKPKTILSPQVIAIGVSTGGPKALTQIINQIPKDIRVPILIVQHIPANFSKPLAESLDLKSNILVKEAVNDEVLKAGVAYIAPGGKQMKVVDNAIRITDDAPEVFCKPSVNYLFRSLAKEFPQRVLPVILTGMGNDGTKGLQLLKRHGAFAIGQNQETCTVYGMPASAMSAGVIDIEVPLQEIVPTILKHL